MKAYLSLEGYSFIKQYWSIKSHKVMQETSMGKIAHTIGENLFSRT
jgi:hypothetical protein